MHPSFGLGGEKAAVMGEVHTTDTVRVSLQLAGHLVDSRGIPHQDLAFVIYRND
jgi:hypothetical protein